MYTLGQAYKLPSNNLTLLRLAASVTVLWFHCYPLALGRGNIDPFSMLLIKSAGIGLGGLAVGAFFVISGFLVTASFDHRKSLFVFIVSRALRIFPGLFVSILFVALIVGPLVTNLPIIEYFSSDRIWRFIARNTTLAFGIQYDLPGAFKTNPWPSGVNGSLWMLPVLLYMYMWVAIVGVLGIVYKRSVFNGVFLVSILTYVAAPDSFPVTMVNGSVRNPLFFAIGSFLYVNRNYIPLNFPVLMGFTILIYLCPKTNLSFAISTLYITYVIFFIAFLSFLNYLNVDRMGDFSYGIYIYSFPIQQVVAYFILDISPIEMFLIVLPIVTLIGFLSWRFIEKPVLALKRKLLMGRRYFNPRVIIERNNSLN
jgi:peptidoglycan/LPS O-acetylase OafA/YrhL